MTPATPAKPAETPKTPQTPPAPKFKTDDIWLSAFLIARAKTWSGHERDNGDPRLPNGRVGWFFEHADECGKLAEEYRAGTAVANVVRMRSAFGRLNSVARSPVSHSMRMMALSGEALLRLEITSTRILPHVQGLEVSQARSIAFTCSPV